MLGLDVALNVKSLTVLRDAVGLSGIGTLTDGLAGWENIYYIYASETLDLFL